MKASEQRAVAKATATPPDPALTSLALTDSGPVRKLCLDIIMGRLKTIAPRVGALAPRIGYVSGDEQARSRHRDATQAWRAWYKTSRWQKLRWSVLVRDLFQCKLCRRIEPNTSQLVADHKHPHRGDEAMFWDEANLQCLCKTCHDKTKQSEERRHADRHD